MKLARFLAEGRPALGVLTTQGIVPLSAELSRDGDMVGLIIRWDDVRAEVERLANAAEICLTTGDAQLLAPIPRPGKLMALGLNYADHVAENNMTPPEHQVWFCKHQTCVNAPFGDVEIPKVSTQIDYEVELVAIIGRRGRHINREDAAAHVFGYCVGNDVSVRDWQLQTPQWMLGKSFDSHAPFGPHITTSDEVGDPHGLGIRCFVNGELRQSSNTSNLIFKVWDQIAHLSQAMTLEPGDIIFTGTPGGVGIAMKPPRFLRAGDVVRCEIDSLGALENLFVSEPDSKVYQA
jgi:ureidoglycolate lyase